MIKADRSVTLKISLTTRRENVKLYQEILQLPLKIVAEESTGLVLGVASIEMEDFMFAVSNGLPEGTQVFKPETDAKTRNFH